MEIGYVRVSSDGQNPARQLEGLSGAEKIFTDKVSGKNTERPALLALKDYCREGDVISVWSIDRLARNLSDLRSLIEFFTGKGVSVHFCKENLTFSAGANDAMSLLMLNLLGAFSEFERNLIRERQAEGVAIAKAAGKYRGRQSKLTAEQLAEIHRLHADGIGCTEIGRRFGLTRQAIHKILKRTEVQQEQD